MFYKSFMFVVFKCFGKTRHFLKKFNTGKLFALTLVCAFAAHAQAAVNCSFSVTQSWGSGGNAQIAITNTGSSTVNIDPFTAQFSSGISVGSSWHTSLSGSNPYTFTPFNWNSSVGAGQTRTYGFSLNGNVSSSTTATLGGACNVVANTPPTSVLSCREEVSVGDFFFTTGGGTAVETYVAVCDDNSFDPDGEIVSSTLDWGDGTVGVQTWHHYVEDGVYSIFHYVVDDDGLHDVNTVQLSMRGNGNPPTAALSCAVSGLTVNCNASASTDPDGDALATVYRWSDGAITPSGIHTYQAAGTYTVYLTVHDGHNTDSTSATVVVEEPDQNPPLEAEFSYTVDGFTVNVDVPYDVTAGISHTWSWGDGSANSTGFPQSHTYAQAGTYTVTLTLQNEAGQTASTSQDVTIVDPDPQPTGELVCSWGSRNNFNSGFVYEVRVQNPGTEVVAGWNVCLKFDPNTRINNPFNTNATVLPPPGNWYCFAPVAWNYNINPGQSWSFGFIGSGPGIVEDVSGDCDSIN